MKKISVEPYRANKSIEFPSEDLNSKHSFEPVQSLIFDLQQIPVFEEPEDSGSYEEGDVDQAYSHRER